MEKHTTSTGKDLKKPAVANIQAASRQKKAGPNRNGGLTCLLQRWVVSNLIGGQAYGPSNQVVVSCFCGRKLVEMIRDYSFLTYFATGLQLTKQQKGSGHKTALNISLEMVHQPCTTAASLSFSRSVNA